jgi:calpain-15
MLKLAETSDGQKFVQIRNPWGESEWSGAYSDASPLWTPALKTELGYEAEEDGTFFMSWEDFVAWFGRYSLYLLY